MMKFNTILIGLLLYLSISSCNSNQIFKEKHNFPKYQWPTNEKVAFNFDLAKENAGMEYFMVINLRYIHGYQYKYLHLRLQITDPEGNETDKEISIQIATDEKKYLGEGMGDYWDLDYLINETIPFNKAGKYTFEIISLMEDDPVYFINDIGITLLKETK